LLRGEPLELVARETNVSIARLSEWRHLTLNGKTLRAIPVNARSGAFASFGGALRRPFGLAPVIIRHVEYSG
jgi:hypothetical protein